MPVWFTALLQADQQHHICQWVRLWTEVHKIFKHNPLARILLSLGNMCFMPALFFIGERNSLHELMPISEWREMAEQSVTNLPLAARSCNTYVVREQYLQPAVLYGVATVITSLCCTCPASVGSEEDPGVGARDDWDLQKRQGLGKDSVEQSPRFWGGGGRLFVCMAATQ